MKKVFLSIFVLLMSTVAAFALEVTWTPIETGTGEVYYWSNVLPGIYANCIPVLENGRAKIAKDGMSVVCKQTNGMYDGISADGLTVINSSAVQACALINNKEVNGKKLTVSLPTRKNIYESREDEKFNFPGIEKSVLWSSELAIGIDNGPVLNINGDTILNSHEVAILNSNNAHVYAGINADSPFMDRSNQYFVRCIGSAIK